MTPTIKNNMAPFISIITATKNAESTLSNLLKSIETQSATSFELVVQDAISTDRTLEILANATHRLPAVQITSERDLGIYDAWNKAVRRAKGQWLLFLGADDHLAEKDVLEKASNTLQAQPDNITFGAGAVRMMDTLGNCTLYAKPVLDGGCSRLKYIAPAAFPGLFIRRDVAESNPFDASLKISADYDFLCRTWDDQKAVGLDFDVCIMLEGGISSDPANQFSAAWENARIAARHFHNVWEIDRARMLIKAGLVSTAFRTLGPERGATLLDKIRQLRGLPPCWKK